MNNLHCIVTGATEGIGRAIASTLGRHGARVAVCARTAGRVSAVVEELTAEGVDAFGTSCDVGSEPSVTGFLQAARDRFGPVDVLVNNAGLAHFTPIEEMTVEAFDETFAVNVRGVFLMTRAVLPDMRSRGRGHIVNIASLAGRNPVPGAAAYAAAKHAVLGFSKSVFAEVRTEGVRVTTICPGSVATPFFEKTGTGLEAPERKLQAQDVADTVLATLLLPERALVSEVDLRPTNP